MELLKGTLDVLILRTLADRSLHGYAISKRIRAISNDVLAVEEGALYPALRRLEKRGWLRAEWRVSDTGRDAKFYELTRTGTRELRRAIADWDRYASAMTDVLHREDGA